MQTKTTSGVAPAGRLLTVEGTIMDYEVDYRMRRLGDEARRERLAGPREGVRQHVGHALMALGRAVHGLEPERPARAARPALDLR